MNSFFNSQFNYCPLVWMFDSYSNNNKINRLHRRVLRIVFNDFNSSFKNLKEKDGTVLIYLKNFKNLEQKFLKYGKTFNCTSNE